MALNREKFKNIVGGITTPAKPEPKAIPSAGEAASQALPETAGQGGKPTEESGAAGEARQAEHRRFAQRGRPKGRKDEPAADKTRKVKVSLYLSEPLVNDLYDWAHADRIHPGEIFDRALRQFHEKEAKRRNAGKE